MGRKSYGKPEVEINRFSDEEDIMSLLGYCLSYSPARGQLHREGDAIR